MIKNSMIRKSATIVALIVTTVFLLEACTKATPDVSDDATLRSLTVSIGALEPAFAADVTNYTVKVGNSVTGITITGEANHAGATLSGDVGTYPLAVGENNFTVTVAAEDGETEMNYTIMVFREQTPVEEPDGIIMTTRASKVVFHVAGSNDITVYWGDGKISNVNDAIVVGGYFKFSLYHSVETVCNIVITGNVTELYCNSIELTALDVKGNTELTKLYCYYNSLTSLNVSRFPKLQVLHCRDNQLTSLDMSRNSALTELICNNNQITALDVSRNTALKTLSCGGNQFTTLDVSQNAALEGLYIGRSPLTVLDVSRNKALIRLYCAYIQITNLDVSNNTALTHLTCRDTQIKGLDLGANTALLHLEVCGNQLIALDVSNNTALKSLCVRNNQLTAAALNDLFRTLPENKNAAGMSLVGNPGVHECDLSIAEEKGWMLDGYNHEDERPHNN